MRRPAIVAAAVGTASVLAIVAIAVGVERVQPAVPANGSSSQPANTISITEFGAVPNDGRSDQDAMAAAIARAANDGRSVWVPAGVFELDAVLSVESVAITGAGMDESILLSTTPTAGAIYLRGTAPALRFLTHEYATVVGRDGGTEDHDSIVVDGALDFDIEAVGVEHASNAGIMVVGASGGRIADSRVDAPNADGIHVTGGSHDITVSGNTVTTPGDDMIAVVSYRSDPAVTHDVRIVGNAVAGGEARGISVVGGEDVTITDNAIRDSRMAGLYISVEAEYDTRDTRRITIADNTVTGCVRFLESGHPSVLVYASQGTIDAVTFTRNRVSGSDAEAFGSWGDGSISHIVRQDNTGF